MNIRILLFLFVLGVPGAGVAGDGPTCMTNPDLVGDCFAVHGRLFVANGTPTFRVWPVGTTRVLGVVGGERPNLPPAFLEFASPTSNLYADFLVCPLSEPRSGEMQNVCIESGDHLVVEELGRDGKPEVSYPVVLGDGHSS